MHKRTIFFFQVIMVIMLSSCRTYKPVTYQQPSGIPENDYINRYGDIAVREMKRTGIPASITLAQGMIESDYGRSSLAREANNHFGIKCHNDWTGATVRHNDDTRNECFRKYRNPEESFQDHSDFLKTGSRYSFLFNIPPTDYSAWARGLKKAGYATNPDYANMLIRKIEQLNLAQFDRGNIAVIKDEKPLNRASEVSVTASAEPVGVVSRAPRVLENNRIRYIIVKDGDTRDKIEKEFQLLRWELPKYNDLNEDFTPVAGQILYFQPKREKAEPGKEFYTANEGDTMYLISQKFGVRLKNLYEMNRMNTGEQPKPGQKIWLRSMKPVN